MIRLETDAVDLMEERISELKEAVNLFMKFLLIYKRHIFLIYENVKVKDCAAYRGAKTA